MSNHNICLLGEIRKLVWLTNAISDNNITLNDYVIRSVDLGPLYHMQIANARLTCASAQTDHVIAVHVHDILTS